MRNVVFVADNFFDALKSLLQLDVPIETAYKLAKNAQAINEAQKTFNELREKLARKHCIKWESDGEGHKAGEPKVEDGKYAFTSEGAQAFAEEMSKLLEIEFAVPYKLKKSDFGSCTLKTEWLFLVADMLEDLIDKPKEKE